MKPIDYSQDTPKESSDGKNPHSELKRKILLAAGQLVFARLWPAETGVAYTRSGHAISYGLKGSADLTGIVFAPALGVGIRVELECKTGTGRQSSGQIAFGAMINRMGGIYRIVRSVDDAMKAIYEAHNKGKKPSD